MSIQTSLNRSLALITLVGAGLTVGAGSTSAQPVAAPDRSADTAVDPILQRSETAEIVFGEIYVSDSNRIIFQTGRSPNEYDYTEYEVGSNTEVFIDGTPADLAGQQFVPGMPATLVPHGENSFMLEQIYVRDPDSTLERSAPPPLPTDVPETPEPGDDRDVELELDPVPEVPIGAEFEPDQRGIRIVVIKADGPMSATEFRLGDTVIQVDGKPVLTADSLYRRLHQFQPGDAVELVAFRGEERIRDQMVLPEDFRPAPPDERTTIRNERVDRIETGPDTSPLIDLGWMLVNTSNGILVYEVEPGGAADEAGFREGDRIVRVQEELVGSSRAVYYRLHHFHAGEPVAIATVRDGEMLTRRLFLPDDFEPIYANDDDNVSSRFDANRRVRP